MPLTSPAIFPPSPLASLPYEGGSSGGRLSPPDPSPAKNATPSSFGRDDFENSSPFHSPHKEEIPPKLGTEYFIYNRKMHILTTGEPPITPHRWPSLTPISGPSLSYFDVPLTCFNTHHSNNHESSKNCWVLQPRYYTPGLLEE